MKSFLSKLNPFRPSGNQFDRYYAGIVGCGSGYPTADEARKDMRAQERQMTYARTIR